MKKKVITQEQIEKFESNTGVKVIDVEKMFIEYEGKQWRPIKNQAEFFCVIFDNEPILNIGECSFVAVNYHS